LGKLFRFTQPLRFGHCDLTGIVYLSHYFDMINSSVEDWFELELGLPFDAFHLQHGYGNPIVSTSCDFLRPCRYGEKMTIELSVANLGRSSIELRIAGKVGAEERILARHTTAMISLDSFRSIAIPDDLRKKMGEYAIDPGGLATPKTPSEYPPANSFRTRQPIRYSHCDPSEIVYFPRFFDLFNNVLEDWFAQELGCPWSGDFMGPRNLRIPTVGIGCQFARGCHLGDMLELELWPTRIGRSSMQVALSGSVGGEACMRVAWTLCVVSSKTFKPVPIPDDIRERMEPFLVRRA
jgi:4-hydroxybenzoyl-CoA thioesterase